MLTIHLDAVKFYAYHGIFKEEKTLGNNYVVDIKIEVSTNNQIVQSISETIDYAEVFNMLQKRMQIPTPLLETIATDFCYTILNKFQLASSIDFSIKKMNPPIEEFIGNVGVQFKLKRSS
ncbi:MAG: dihydroneopterin aldolase [Sediminibacterium sp.]